MAWRGVWRKMVLEAPVSWIYMRDMGKVVRTKLFLSNRTQAVRLPKDVAFPPGVEEVEIIREGDRVVVVPAGRRWDDFFAEPGVDFPDREQPAWQEREPF